MASYRCAFSRHVPNMRLPYINRHQPCRRRCSSAAHLSSAARIGPVPRFRASRCVSRATDIARTVDQACRSWARCPRTLPCRLRPTSELRPGRGPPLEAGPHVATALVYGVGARILGARIGDRFATSARLEFTAVFFAPVEIPEHLIPSATAKGITLDFDRNARSARESKPEWA